MDKLRQLATHIQHHLYDQEKRVITYLKAKYIGDEGDSDYHAGQVYFLEVRQHWFGRITVRPTHGYRFKPLEDMRLVYHNLEVFLASWNILHIVETDET